MACRSFCAVGVDPAVMGVGPAVAIPAAVKAAGLQIEDIDLFELNEVNNNHLGTGLRNRLLCTAVYLHDLFVLSSI